MSVPTSSEPKPRGAPALSPSSRPRSSSGSSARRTAHPSPAWCSYDFVKEERRVGIYYFYVLDAEFGPGFIKICTYFPYPAKVWLNGHEWAKRQARQEGSASPRWPTASRRVRTPSPSRPSATGSGPSTSRGSSTDGPRSSRHRSPTPTAAGYFWELSMRQVEVSRTLVFDDPRRARAFFESLVTDNIDIGRPDEVAVFARHSSRRPTTLPSRSGSSPPAPRCTWTSPTSTAASSNT